MGWWCTQRKGTKISVSSYCNHGRAVASACKQWWHCVLRAVTAGCTEGCRDKGEWESVLEGFKEVFSERYCLSWVWKSRCGPGWQGDKMAFCGRRDNMCSHWHERDGLVRKLRNSFTTVKSGVRACGWYRKGSWKIGRIQEAVTLLWRQVLDCCVSLSVVLCGGLLLRLQSSWEPGVYLWGWDRYSPES